MKRLCCLAVLVLCAALARADWRIFLREEPERQKRDDTPFVTLDRLLSAEQAATPADAPYLFLYATLKLNAMQWAFRGHGRTSQLPDLARPSQSWASEEANALLKARMARLPQDFPRYAKAAAEPFVSAMGRRRPWLSWPNASALALTWQILWADDAEVSAHVLKAAQAADDAMLEGMVRLAAISREPNERQTEALAAMEKERLWPDDIQAAVRLAQAGARLVKREDAALPEAVRLLTEARDLATLHTIKAEAQNRLNRLRQAELEIVDLPQVVPPGEPFRVRVRHRNARGAEVVFSGAAKVLSAPLSLATAMPYAWGETVAEMPALPPGRHVATFRCDNPFEGLRAVEASHTFYACTFTVAKVGEQTRPSAQREGAREAFAHAYVVADVRTGEPIPGATVTLVRKQEGREAKEEAVWQATTDALGLARVPEVTADDVTTVPPPACHLRVSARGETLELPGHTATSVTRAGPSIHGAPLLRVFSDRALYRPGETVRAQLVLYAKNDLGAYVPAPGAKGTLTIFGHTATGRRTMLEKGVAFSDFGSLAEEVALPGDFVGSLSLLLRTDGAEVRAEGPEVAEFKAPNFTVTLERERLGTPLSEPVRYKGAAIDLSGTPLIGAAVAWEVGGMGEPVRGVTTVGADGAFAFAARLPNPDHDQGVSAIVRVLNANGERQEARCWDFLPHQGYRFEGETPQWIVEGEPFEMTLRSERESSGTVAAMRGETNVVARVAFAKPGSVRLTLPAGAYDLVAEGGVVTNHVGHVVVLPRDGRLGEAFGEHIGALLCARRQGPFALGDEMELFAGIRGEGPAFLMVSTREGVERVLPLVSPFHTLTVGESLRGGFALTVYGFDQGRFRACTETFRTKPPETLKVEAVRFAAEARPGSEQTWEIAVDDPAAELVVTCYDKALDALRENDWKPFAPPWRYWGTWNLTTALLNPSSLWLEEPLPHDFCDDTRLAGARAKLSRSMRGDASPPVAVAMGNAVCSEEAGAADGVMEAKAESSPPWPKPRSGFARTALWAPQKRLKDGKAVFTFTLPDSLTTWKLMAFAYTPDGRSGTLARDCVARLDVMLKPYLPRALRVGDRLTLTVLLSNATDRPRPTWAELNRAERRRVTLPAKGSAAVSWEVTAQPVPGTQTFEFTTEGDAVRLDLPVLDDRVTMEDVYPLTLADTTPVTITVAEPAPLLDLSLRWDYAPAAAVAESLRAFLPTPEAGHEDLFSRLAALRLLQAMGAAPKGADAQAEALLARLLAQRTPEGLWTWFPGGEGDGCVSAEICLGAARLHLLGLAPEALETAVRDTLGRRPKDLPFAVWAYAVSILSPELAQADATMADRLFRAYREAGSVQERRMIALAAQRLGADTVAEQGLKDTLAAMNASETWGAWWPQERTWWHRWHTPLESHALGLEQLRAAGRDAEAKAAARWLLQHRRLNGWGTSRATLAAAFALCGDPTGQAITPTAPPKVRIATRRPEGGQTRKITFARETPGLSFGSLAATYRLPLDKLPPPLADGDAALTLTRTLEPAEPKVGDTVTVTLTLTAAQPMSHVRLRDERPANTEPERVLPWWDNASGGYVVPGDTGTDVWIAALPRGVTAVRYRLKATHAGRCTPGVATAAPTVAPDFAARTDSRPLTVR